MVIEGGIWWFCVRRRMLGSHSLGSKAINWQVVSRYTWTDGARYMRGKIFKWCGSRANCCTHTWYHYICIYREGERERDENRLLVCTLAFETAGYFACRRRDDALNTPIFQCRLVCCPIPYIYLCIANTILPFCQPRWLLTINIWPNFFFSFHNFSSQLEKIAIFNFKFRFFICETYKNLKK